VREVERGYLELEEPLGYYPLYSESG
jgi:hypothetical protein